MGDDDVDLDLGSPASSADLTALKATIQRMQEAALSVQNKHKRAATGGDTSSKSKTGGDDDGDESIRGALSVLRKALLKVKALLRNLAHEVTSDKNG